MKLAGLHPYGDRVGRRWFFSDHRPL